MAVVPTTTASVSVMPTSSMTISTTSTTSFTPPVCSVAPTGASTICPGSSGTCYQYNYLGNTDSYEIECSTLFTGSTQQPLLTFDLNDCINQCQYANVLRPLSCLGVSFLINKVGQGTTNNCYPWSSITCGTRGNATYNSARLLYAGYPSITDFNDPTFNCGSASSSVAAAASSTVQAASSQVTSRVPTTTAAAQAATTTSTTPVNDLSQASSTNFPNGYPQDPICNNNLQSTYFGKSARPVVGLSH
jgi:hypothetical protein